MLHQPTFAPVPMLAADVNCFWALEQDQESFNREVYLPDASTVHVIGLRFADELTRIVADRGYGEAIDCYQEFVCQTAYRQKHDVTRIRTAGHWLRRSHGQIRMTDLAAQSHLSASQLERTFKHYTAISPKAYARIVRFGSLQAGLLVNPSIRLAELAEVYGYSDQAHLIREFKSFADRTPRDFAATAPAYFELRQYEDWRASMKQSFDLAYDQSIARGGARCESSW
jgi:AraC-like DNA-binding protein